MPTPSDTDFNNVLKELNDEQRDAVTTTEGPVMVIAGPGTGKTQILAARAGEILNATDIDATNILCLTYTEAGAVAMRNRLIRFIGAEAHRVHIHTFHSFCNWVIQSNPDHFPGMNAEPMSDLEKVEIAEEILNSLPEDHPLKKLKGSYRSITSNWLKLMDIMKEENWSPDDVQAMHQQYIDELPHLEKLQYKRNYGDAKKGDVNPRLLNLEIEKVDKLVPAAALYPQMEKEKKKRGLYDFSDMILWVTQAFRENENLLRDHQEKFLYIMVDEYQDTSGSQQNLVNLLCAYWENPNLFVVGDDDQSIYRFQGANIENIVDFYKKYDRFMTLVVLKDNYRSTQNILDVSKQLIGNNSSRLVNTNAMTGLDKDIRSVSYSGTQPYVELLSYPNPVHEAVDIGNRIIALIRDGVPSADIAVIYRSHKESEDLMRFLRLSKIPIRTRRKTNVLELSVVHNYLEALRYVVSEARQAGSGDGLLFRILHFDTSVRSLDMARLSLWTEQERRQGRYHSLREVLEKIRSGDEPASRLSDPGAIAAFSAHIEKWITLYYTATPTELAENILHKGGFVAHALTSERKGFLLEALHTIFGFIQSEARKDPRAKIDQIIRKIDLMNEHGLQLEVEEIINDQAGVQFTTAHSAKGLEFQYVFMIGCVKNSWEKFKDRKPFGLHHLVQGDPENVVREESRRLFYVAMTRAKTHLVLSTYTHNLNGKDQEVSTFITEIESSGHVRSSVCNAGTEEVESFLIRSGQESTARLMHILDDDLLDSRLTNYHLSVTHLNTYLRCPVDFYFTGLLRVPAMKNKYMSYGTAVHTALDNLIKARKSPDYNPDHLVTQFEKAMKRERSAFTEQEFSDMLAHGKISLNDFMEQYREEWLRPDECITEKKIDNVLVNDVPIKGQLDKIELFGNEVNVVDYKTGKPENAYGKLKPPKADAGEEDSHEARFGGDYWRQLVFYYLLMDGQKEKPWRMMSGEMDFVEPRKNGTYLKHKWFVNEEEIELVRNQIVDVYGKIMNRDFADGCNEEDCIWCEFVREHLNSSS